MSSTTANKPKISTLAAVVLALVMLAAVISDIKSFDLTYQAWDLWLEGFNPISAFSVGHPHAMRYVVYYPVFIVSEVTKLPVDLVFSFICSGMLLVLWLTLSAIEEELKAANELRKLAYILAFFALAVAMNGRLILAFTGFALLIWAFVTCAARLSWGWGNLAALTAGTLLTAVSSGTLSVAALYAFLGTVWLLCFGRTLAAGTKIRVAASTVAVLGIFATSLAIGLVKNIDYFGGGLGGSIGMLDHGLGRVFLVLGPLGVAIAALGAVLATVLTFVVASRLPLTYAILSLAVLPAAIGGLFGISTLAVGVVPAVLLLRTQLAGLVFSRRFPQGLTPN